MVMIGWIGRDGDDWIGRWSHTSQLHRLRRVPVHEIHGVERLVASLLQERLQLVPDITGKARVHRLFQEDLFATSGELLESGELGAIVGVAVGDGGRGRGVGEDALEGRVLACLLAVELHDEVFSREVQQVPLASHLNAEETGGCLQEYCVALALEGGQQALQGLARRLSLLLRLRQVLPLDHQLPHSRPPDPSLDRAGQVSSQFYQFLVVLGFSEELDVGVDALAVGVEAVDVGVGEREECIYEAEGVEVGAVDHCLAAAEVVVNEVPAVAADVVDGVDGIWHCGSQCEEGEEGERVACGKGGCHRMIQSIQMQQIQALRFDVEEVGKHVKGSKKRYCWEIALRDKSHVIALDFSFLSGKIKITVDRKILLENELPADIAFQYPFNLDGFALNIIQQGESFELRINNKVFSHLYTQQKTNTEFKKYEDEVKDIKVDLNQLNPQGKKISLNIGAFGAQGGMKKKKEAAEQGSWNAFAGGSFPSYFGEEPKVEKASPAKKSNLLDDQEENAVAARTANEFNLLQASQPEVKQSSNLFELISSDPSPPPQQGNQQEFSNMQEMFNSLSVSNNKPTELDFFAEDPKPSVIKEDPKPPAKAPSAFDFSQQGPGLSNFGTGFGLEGMGQLNAKSFATTSGNGKAFDLGSLDFSIPVKQEQPIAAFSKKSSAQEGGAYGPMDQVFAQSLNPPAPAATPNINDFNTMQLMFQTTNFGNPQDFGFGQQQQLPQTQLPPQLVSNQPFQGETGDFSTSMLRMFETGSAGQAPPLSQMSLNAPGAVAPKSGPNPLDLFSNNKPATFATTSGGNFPASFDMSSFGTMQAGAKGNLEVNFFDAKPSKPSGTAPSSGDLI